MEIELPRNTGTDGDGIVRDLREDSDIRDARYGAGPHKFFEMKLIQVGAAKAVFGWPLFATWNAWIYASAHHGWAAKVGTFLTFVPVLAITTVIWAALLAAIIWLLWRLA